MGTLKYIQDTRLSQTYYTLNDITHFNIKVLEYYERELNMDKDSHIVNGRVLTKMKNNNARILKDIKLKMPIIKDVLQQIDNFEKGIYYSLDFSKHLAVLLHKYKYLIPPFARINNIPFKL
jgi:hypothetical protein